MRFMVDQAKLPTEYRIAATGLQFPEGPVPMNDGSVLVVEIPRGTLTRVSASGELDVVAECGGGPNGCAIGPDGKAYIANNGGSFSWIDLGGLTLPGPLPDTWVNGTIQRVDIDTGEVETLYDSCDGRQLRAPNDLVFDDHGGFWFTDHGVREERSSDRSGVFYAKADGSEIREVIFPLDAPNGVGLSPLGDKVYVAETYTGRVWSWDVHTPGTAEGAGLLEPHGNLLTGLPDLQYLDSLAVDAEGNVCVGTLINGGITVISADGGSVGHVGIDDLLVTNIAFRREEGTSASTAYITSSGTGRLLTMDWFC